MQSKRVNEKYTVQGNYNTDFFFKKIALQNKRFDDRQQNENLRRNKMYLGHDGIYRGREQKNTAILKDYKFENKIRKERNESTDKREIYKVVDYY